MYDALHDPVTLRQILPGCQSLTTAGGKSQISSLVKIGPIRATVSTTVEVFNEDRPAGYSLYAIANAGNAGSGAGTAHVALAAVDEDTTNLAYHISADLDGRIAELGDDVLEETARTLIAEFFSRLKLLLETPDAERREEPREAIDVPQIPEREVEPTEATTPLPSPPLPTQTPAGWAARQDTPASTRMVLGQSSEPAELSQEDEIRPGEEPAGYGLTPSRYEREGPSDERVDEPQAERSGSHPHAPKPTHLQASEGMSSTKRWLLVALGVAVIAYLLSGGF